MSRSTAVGALAGKDNVVIAHEQSVSRPTMQLWRRWVPKWSSANPEPTFPGVKRMRCQVICGTLH